MVGEDEGNALGVVGAYVGQVVIAETVALGHGYAKAGEDTERG